MKIKQLLALVAGVAGLPATMSKVVGALVQAGGHELTGVAALPAPKPAALAADPAQLPALLRALATPEGSTAYRLELADAQAEAAARLVEYHTVPA